MSRRVSFGLWRSADVRACRFQDSLLVVLLCLYGASGCGPKEEPAAPTTSPETPQSTPVPTTEPEPAEPEAAVQATPAPTPIPLEALCQSKCDGLVSQCTSAAVETCRAGCEQWTRTPEPCLGVVRRALTCWKDASDIGCAPISPESCNKQFLAVAECRKAPESFQDSTEEEATGSALPQGWERVEDRETGFSVLMPHGAVLETTAGRTWRATSSNGLVYKVHVHPALPKTPDSRGWIKLASEILAPCNLKTRLHGLIEKPGLLALRYDSGCHDGGERHGMFYVLSKVFIVLSIEGAESEHAETFVYGLELL